MKRFLHIINLGGSAMNFIGDQFSYMHKYGDYEMHLICTPCDNIDEFVKLQGIHYYPVIIERQIRIWKDIVALWKIFRYIRKNNIDIIVGHQAKGTLLAMTAGWLARVPHKVVIAHGFLADTMQGTKKRIVVFENRIVSRLAQKIICVSPSLAIRRREEKIDKPNKQVVLGKGTCNGVDTIEKFNPQHIRNDVQKALKKNYGISKEDIVIGFVGRLVRDKGIVELVTAFQQLLKSFQEKSLKLLVIGKIEKRDGIPSSIIDYLRESPNVLFSGTVPYQDIPYYYSLMDMLILPSYREGFGMVVLEASAMEVPVIVSRSTGCVDSIIDNHTGIYCDITPQSIVSAIERLFNCEYACQLGKNGRRWVSENFEHVIVRQKYLDFYNQFFMKENAENM